MNDNNDNNLATKAIDNYLDIMLDSDEHMACEQKPDDFVPLSGSKLYHIASHPLHKQNITSQDTRHQLEKVERLLDDFNQRQNESDSHDKIIKATKATKTQVAEKKSNIILQPILLQPEIIEQEITDSEVVTEELNSADTVETEISETGAVVREDWSEVPFQILLFDVAGLPLALPLIKLGGIHKIEKKPTSLFGKPDWFMGLIPGHNGNISVIDTARWVMPEKYLQTEMDGSDYQFIITLGNSNWGLACNIVRNAKSVSPDQIRWRAASSKRPWLAGMLIDDMCALLDVDTLINLFDKN